MAKKKTVEMQKDGAIANPLAAQVPVWEKKGWKATTPTAPKSEESPDEGE